MNFETPPRRSLSPVARLALLRQHGSFALAYSVAFQPGLEHFGDERGFLAYKMVGRTAFVLADPVAPREDHARLIGRFVEDAGDVCFWQVSRSVAEILAPMGFFINEMGPEVTLDLGAYTFKGPQQRNLRTAVKRMAQAGYVTEERPLSSIDPAELHTVSHAWRRTRIFGSRELTFLVRPVVLEDEPDVRKFVTFDRAGKLAAFGFFDPVYGDGDVIGYLYSVKRRLPGTDPLANYAIMYRAIESFQSEGLKLLSLGLCPFAKISGRTPFRHDRFARRAFGFLYKKSWPNRYLYPFQGLFENKSQHGGTIEQTYYANTRPGLPRLVKMLRACGMV